MLPILLLCLGVAGIGLIIRYGFFLNEGSDGPGAVSALVMFIGSGFLIICGIAGIKAELNPKPPTKPCACSPMN